MKAPLPPNEAQRLETLRGYDVLDTPPEPAFDDLTLLAAQICQAPIALISLVDENRQWFKSTIGVSATETSRDFAFCAHAILYSGEVLEVRDAQLDPRFADNPLVTADPHIRFYAGAPLVAPDGLALGTLCVIDRVPRVLSAEQQTALRALSHTVVAQLELRRTLAAHRRAEEQLQSLNASLEQKVEARTAELRREMEVHRESEQQYRTLADSGQALIWASGTDKLCNYFNKSWLEFTGRALEQELGNGWADGVHADDFQRCLDVYMSSFDRREKFSMDYRLRRCDGEYRWIQDDGCPRYNSEGEFIGYIGYCLDITARKQADAQLKLAAKVFEQSGEAFLITDANSNIVMVNRAFTVISGYSEAEALGQNSRMLSSGYQDQDFYRAMWESINTQGHWEGELLGRRKDGSLYPKWLSISRVLNAVGDVTHYVGIFSDISQHKKTEERAQYLAQYDVLTGLPNRSMIYDRIDYACTLSRRGEGTVATMLIDLDRFKVINDSLGSAQGDELLKQVAVRLSDCLRESDTVGRTGSNEFVMILLSMNAAADVRVVVKKVLEVLAAPLQIAEHQLHLTASIGIAIAPGDGENAQELLRSAATALHQAKKDGRNQFCFFQAEMNQRAQREMRLESGLHRALEKGEFELHYQPKVDLHSGEICGLEALLRWRHPERGLISPADFIPALEENGLIVPVGEWVLHTACTQAKVWHGMGIESCSVSVNLSAVQFHLQDLCSVVQKVLGETGLEAKYLELEITESTIMKEVNRAIHALRELKALGVRLSVDDFGTGHSSLNYLKRFAMDVLKIDQSFIRDITTDADDALITRAIIDLAHNLRMQVIAEGVETEAQLAFLLRNNCDEMQGYYYSKPLPVEGCTALLKEGRLLSLECARP